MVKVSRSNRVKVNVIFAVLLHKTCALFTLKQLTITINGDIFTEDNTML